MTIMNDYIVYDGRWLGVPDDALPLAIITASTDEEAVEKFHEDFLEEDAVLTKSNQFISSHPKARLGFGFH